MSLFFVGGTLGHALGPLIAATVFGIVALHGMFWIAPAILIVSLGLLAAIPFARPSATPSGDHPL